MTDPTENVEGDINNNNVPQGTEGQESGDGASQERQEGEAETPDTWEPPIRKSPIDYIRERKQRQADRQKNNKQQQSKELDESDEDYSGQDDIDKRIEDRVSKILEPVSRFLQDNSDNVEITNFLSQPENSIFKKYEQQARKYIKAHPNLPARSIFRDLAFDDAQVIGAERLEKSKSEAKRTSAGGSSRRSGANNELPNFSKMNPGQIDEFNRSLRNNSIQTD